MLSAETTGLLQSDIDTIRDFILECNEVERALLFGSRPKARIVEAVMLT